MHPWNLCQVFIMMNEKIDAGAAITLDEINQCIAVLTQLNTDTDQIFEIPKEQRTALIKEAGRFSRLDRDEFAKRKKDTKALAKRKQEEQDFQPPLDIVDGAARVMDPLFDGINTGKHWCGKFLKDCRPITW